MATKTGTITKTVDELTRQLNEARQELSDRNLKITALTERISQIVAEYENKVADLRVEYTNAVNREANVPEEN